ncbi:MAG: 23S rRNA (pseudouridine(1915)-N(3))-methyltransferase RlmH [Caulobacterales bacterium]|nr:23S rRNA (pseudouridine(1915)-N(3))-methyltransferase RlmH [Caulobacterales bacterium]MCA0372372.1 23S rRNA (pseudouridine(1915)-N(3))-methyltransferase RlmH [Pseudomonadota bacterium]
MKITLAAIGKFRNSEPEQALALDYLKRAEVSGRPLGINGVKLQEYEIKAKDNVKVRESNLLRENINNDCFLIVLDERGQNISSRQLAAMFEKQMQNGTKEIIFAIGGADGHDEDMRKKGNFLLSFSKLTWPHKLCRIMASEQIYRAVSIMANSPYHRD